MTMTRGGASGFTAWGATIARTTLFVAMMGVALPLQASPAPQNLILASQTAEKRPVAAQRAAAAARAPQPVVTVSRTAPGQAGYIHYFVITGPDGEPETQVGIELPGDRIAWSVPELGVNVSPFMRSGQITANGKAFDIEYLYGIRPVLDDAALRTLQRELEARVAWWVGEKTPYCDEELPPNRLCVSCLGFVLRVLYPGSSTSFPAMPAEFKSARKNMYTTEDLLLYLAGVRVDTPREARLKRIAALEVPDNMREELLRIATVDTIGDAPRPAVAKPRSAARSVAKRALPRRGS